MIEKTKDMKDALLYVLGQIESIQTCVAAAFLMQTGGDQKHLNALTKALRATATSAKESPDHPLSRIEGFQAGLEKSARILEQTFNEEEEKSA